MDVNVFLYGLVEIRKNWVIDLGQNYNLKEEVCNKHKIEKKIIYSW